MSRHQGACHCGALRYCYETDAMPAQWSVRACQCSFCRLHASLTTSDPKGGLVFEVTERAIVQRYRFGGGIADFLICRHCGVYTGAVFRSGETGYGIVNVRALRPLPADLPMASPMCYEDESPDARIARRTSRWTPLHEGSL
jgi:hypothetical protein